MDRSSTHLPHHASSVPTQPHPPHQPTHSASFPFPIPQDTAQRIHLGQPINSETLVPQSHPSQGRLAPQPLLPQPQPTEAILLQPHLPQPYPLQTHPVQPHPAQAHLAHQLPPHTIPPPAPQLEHTLVSKIGSTISNMRGVSDPVPQQPPTKPDKQLDPAWGQSMIEATQQAANCLQHPASQPVPAPNLVPVTPPVSVLNALPHVQHVPVSSQVIFPESIPGTQPLSRPIGNPAAQPVRIQHNPVAAQQLPITSPSLETRNPPVAQNPPLAQYPASVQHTPGAKHTLVAPKPAIARQVPGKQHVAPTQSLPIHESTAVPNPAEPRRSSGTKRTLSGPPTPPPKRPRESRRESSASKPSSPPSAPSSSNPPSKPSSPGSDPKPNNIVQKKDDTWFDIIRALWPTVERLFPNRKEFRAREIQKVIGEGWSTVRPDEKRPKSWKLQLAKCMRLDNAMFVKVPGKEKHDLYAMHNLEYSAKRTLPTDVEHEEVIPRATIPPEWTQQPVKPVRLSPFDKSASLNILSDDGCTVKGHKGYRMVRATGSVLEGDWYFEVEVLQTMDMGDAVEGAVRVGWSQRRSDVETPVGFDAYGFGLRDRGGDFIHMARRRRYGISYSKGDVIGCRISLPNLTEEEKEAVRKAEQRWLDYRFLQFLQGAAPADSGVDIRRRARVEWYKNGVSMGVPQYFTEEDKAVKETNRRKSSGKKAAKKEMKAGMYYPSVALYENAIAKVRFGPSFKYAMPEGARPMADCLPEAVEVEDMKNGHADMEGVAMNGETVVERAKGEGVGKEKEAEKRVGFGAPSVGRIGHVRNEEQRTGPEPMAVEG